MGYIPSILFSMASWMGISKICLCLQTSTTLRSFCCTSFVAPLYAHAVASAMTGEKATRKSSLRRALDCWATSTIPQVISIQTAISISIFRILSFSNSVARVVCMRTVCQVYQVQSLIAPRILQTLQPQLARSVCMSPTAGSVQ